MIRRLGLDLPDELIRRFRVWCLQHNTTMKAEVLRLIEDRLKK